MSDKMISAVYGTLSAAVWGATIALLIFIIFLFCTGRYRSPVFAVESVTLGAADENDPALREYTGSADGWYKADYRVSVTGAKLSPYSYDVKNVAFDAPNDVKHRMEYFAVCGDEIEYSAFSPDEFTVSLYVKCTSPAQAKDVASRAAFGFRGLKQRFGFFYKELVIDLPGFSVADFDVPVQTLPA